MKEKDVLHTEGVKPGVYVAIKVDPVDRERVLLFCERDLSIDMKNSASPYASVKEGMHATLLAAKDAKNQTQESVQKHLSVNEFEATPSHWEIFTSPNNGKKCLVLKLESPQMKNFHEKLKQETGLRHSFDDFALHVSVHYDYNGKIPKEIPQFKIKFRETFTKPYHFVQKITEVKTEQEVNSNMKYTQKVTGVNETSNQSELAKFIKNEQANQLDFKAVLGKVEAIRESFSNIQTSIPNIKMDNSSTSRPRFH